jgi:hypothetical protein
VRDVGSVKSGGIVNNSEVLRSTIKVKVEAKN